MKKALKSIILLLSIFIFIFSGCSTEKKIKFEGNKLIYKGAFYSADDNSLPIICEGTEVVIDRFLSVFGVYTYYQSSLDENNNIIYDGRQLWFKDGFVPPNDNEESIYKMYLVTNVIGKFNTGSKQTEVIQFDNTDSTHLNDIIEECPIDEVDIKNSGFWLNIVYSNYTYMSVSYYVYVISDEIYVSKYYENDHLYKVTDTFKNYFIEAINQIS